MDKRLGLPLLAVLLSLCLTGCGDKLYEMTEEERGLVTGYAGYVVAMHNTYQKDGLISTSIVEMEMETESEQASGPQNSESNTEQTTSPEGGNKGEQKQPESQTNETAGTVTVAQAVGHPEDLSISYKGCEVKKSYMQGEGYSVSAPSGRTFIVAKFKIKNNSAKKVYLDNLSLGPRFLCSYNGSESKVSAEMTFLENDLGTFADNIKAGKSVSAVLLFAVPEKTGKISDFSLSVSVDGTESQINL